MENPYKSPGTRGKNPNPKQWILNLYTIAIIVSLIVAIICTANIYFAHVKYGFPIPPFAVRPDRVYLMVAYSVSASFFALLFSVLLFFHKRLKAWVDKHRR